MRTLLADGPLKQETEFVLHLDGTTVGEVDLDKLGGKTSATSKIVSETTLMSYLKKPDSQEIFVTANRTLYPGKKAKFVLFAQRICLSVSLIETLPSRRLQKIPRTPSKYFTCNNV